MNDATTVALFKGESAAELLPLGMIEPWEHNPRRTRDETKLGELADSIAKVGVLQPILVRPVRDGAMFRIVVGERRWRAAQHCGLTHIPAVVRDMSEAEALELAMTENLQREDVPPLEEAEGYERLHHVHGYSVEEIADRVGKSRGYVYARLKLTALCGEARDIVRDYGLSPTLALLIARIPVPSHQVEAATAISSDHTGRPMSVTEATRHIRRRYMLDLATAPFPRDDATLCPAAGSCVDCHKRTGNQAELFGDIGDTDVCTDSTCFEGKVTAAHERRAEQLEDDGFTVVRGEEAKKIVNAYGHVMRGYEALDDECPHDEHGERTWREVLDKAKMPLLHVDAGEERGFIVVVPTQDAMKVLVKKGIVPAEEAKDVAEDGRDATPKRPIKTATEIERERHQRTELLRALLIPGPIDGELSPLEWREIALALSDNYWPEPETRQDIQKEIIGDCESIVEFIETAPAGNLQQLVLLMALYQYAETNNGSALDRLKAIVADVGLDAEDIATAAGKVWDATRPSEPEPAASAASPAKPKKARKKKAEAPPEKIETKVATESEWPFPTQKAASNA